MKRLMVLVAVATLLAAGAALSQEVRISPPRGCTMTGDATGRSCSVTLANGSILTVVLMLDAIPVNDLPSAERRALADAPEEWMGRNLVSQERSISGSPPGPGQKLIRASNRLLDRDELPPGTDVCLHYDLDFSTRAPEGPGQGRLQLDNTGLWCHALRAGKLQTIQLEVLNFHGETGRRLSGFEATAGRVLSSLRVDW